MKIMKLTVVRFMPPVKIETQLKLIKENAYFLLNGGVRGSGRAGSPMYIGRVFIMSGWLNYLLNLML